jgi:hypothetical protein
MVGGIIIYIFAVAFIDINAIFVWQEESICFCVRCWLYTPCVYVIFLQVHYLMGGYKTYRHLFDCSFIFCNEVYLQRVSLFKKGRKFLVKILYENMHR